MNVVIVPWSELEQHDAMIIMERSNPDISSVAGRRPRAEARFHRQPDKNAQHESFLRTLFDTLRTDDQVAIDERGAELMKSHNRQSDCWVLAESEVSRQTVLLSRDARFVDRLKDKTNLRLCRPSEYWASLSLPRGARPNKVPHESNPLTRENWWRWE